jgi:hypothetical protein
MKLRSINWKNEMDSNINFIQNIKDFQQVITFFLDKIKVSCHSIENSYHNSLSV